MRDPLIARPMPAGPFPVIYADPPWRYDSIGLLGPRRQIERNQYPTMTLEDILALQVPDARDSVLFLWSTSAKLAEALHVIEAWGFRLTSTLAWVKDRIGMGYYFRQRHELLLFGVRGNPGTPAPEHRPDSVLRWPRGRHSAKPEIVYLNIERMYAGPYLELFARPPFREGWSTWGNETYESSEQRFLFTPGVAR